MTNNKVILSRYNSKFKKKNFLDDLKFRALCLDKEVVEEILRVVLNDGDLKVIKSLHQVNIDQPIFHGVILDCVCQLKSKEIVNIEVQVAANDNAEMRMRYNGSMVTIENTPKRKGFKYREIPKLILIMFCKFDLFRQGNPIYEIDRVVRGTNIISNNGIREVYVNLKATKLGNKLAELFKIMCDVKYGNIDEYPKLTSRKMEVQKLYVGGENKMSGLTLEIYKDGEKAGKKAGVKQGTVTTILRLVKKKLLSVKDAAKELSMSERKVRGLLSA